MSKTHQLTPLPEHRFEFTPEERAKVLEAWGYLKENLGEGELLSRFTRWAFQRTPVFTARPDLRFHNTHVGYVYAIMDPRIEGDKNIIFVGSSMEPWVAVKKNLTRSTNYRMQKYCSDMLAELRVRGHVFWREKEVVDAWEENREITRSKLDGIEIPWKILGLYLRPESYQEELEKLAELGISANDAEPNRSRNEWAELLKDEGHPILNNTPGRVSELWSKAKETGKIPKISHTIVDEDFEHLERQKGTDLGVGYLPQRQKK